MRRVPATVVLVSGFTEHILHVDMDAFFVEVERLDDPSLRGVPVVVGGLGRRGVVASASYEARARGVRSAMPIGEARRLCPTARFVAPSHRRYREVSGQVFEILRSFSPAVEGISIDEAFLDVAGLRLLWPDAVTVGAEIRAAVRSRIGIPASVGCATTKFIAKLASARAKPDGLLVVEAGTELRFLHPLPVTDLWGVGAATQAALASLGIRTIGDVANTPVETLVRTLGSAVGTHLHDLANGRDPREVGAGPGTRSVSVEETFTDDIVARDDLERELVRLCDRLEGRLRRAGMRGRTVTLKVRFSNFATVTRSATVDGDVGYRSELWSVVRGLLDRARVGGRAVRLLGVGVSGLGADTGARRLRLGGERADAAARAAASVKERFGEDAIVPARLVEPPPDTEGRRLR